MGMGVGALAAVSIRLRPPLGADDSGSDGGGTLPEAMDDDGIGAAAAVDASGISAKQTFLVPPELELESSPIMERTYGRPYITNKTNPANTRPSTTKFSSPASV